MSTVGPAKPGHNSEPPDGGGGWQQVVVLLITATALTLTAIFTHSVELAALVGSLLRPR